MWMFITVDRRVTDSVVGTLEFRSLNSRARVVAQSVKPLRQWGLMWEHAYVCCSWRELGPDLAVVPICGINQ